MGSVFKLQGRTAEADAAFAKADEVRKSYASSK
jgi:hypothetical protein